MSRLERGMLGLYGGAWLALLAVTALTLWYGRGFELLLNNDGSGAWVYLGLWAAMAAALAALPRADQGWRMILKLSAVGLLVIAAAGWWRSASYVAVAASLIGVAAIMLCLAPLLDATRIQRKRPQRERARRPVQMQRRHLTVAWIAWALALALSFWSAWRGEYPAERGSGAVLLLGVFLLALPAVVLGAWRRRIAALWLTLMAVLSLPLVTDAGMASIPTLLLLAAGGFALADKRGGEWS